MKHLSAVLLFVLMAHPGVHAQNSSPVYPSDKSVVSDTTLQLIWNPVNGSGITYHLQVAADSLFVSPLHNLSGLQVHRTVVAVSPGQKYWWRTQHSVSGIPQGWSSPYSFTIFSPAQVPGITIWLDPAAGTTLSANKVSGWQSRIGTYALGQSNATKMPLLSDTLPMGYPALIFDGTDDFLEGPFLGYPGFTIAILHSPLNKNSTLISQARFSYTGFNWYITNAQRPSLNCLQTPSNIAYTFSGYPYPFTIPSTRSTIDGIAFKNTGTTLYTGLLDSSSTQTISFMDVPSVTFFRIGAMGNNSNWYKGHVYEIILADSTLPEADYRRIYDYLSWKYQPPVNLGPDTLLTYSLCGAELKPIHPRYLSYQWSTGDTTPAILVKNSGTYWLQATDFFGRVSRDTIMVISQVPVINLQDTTICLNGQAIFSPGIPGTYLYQWDHDPLQNQSYLITSTAGYHSVKVTDTSNCSVTDSALVTIDTYALSVSLGPDRSACTGEVLALATGASQTVSYQWSTGIHDTLPHIQVQNPGTYTVTTTNPQGCPAVSQVQVAIKGVSPVVAFQLSGPKLCLHDTLFLTDLTQQGSPSDSLSLWEWALDTATLHTAHATYLFQSPGIYPVSLKITTDSGCFGSLTDTVQVLPLPTASITHGTACAGSPVLFSANPGGPSAAVFNWLFYNGTATPDTANTAQPAYSWAAGGHYGVTVRVTDTSGCSTADSVSVQVFNPPSAAFTFTPDPACDGNQVTFTDASTFHPAYPVNYRRWDFGDGSPAVQNLVSPKHTYPAFGSYNTKLLVSSSFTGCKDSITGIVRIHEVPTAVITGPTFCTGQEKQLTEASFAGSDSIVSWTWVTLPHGTLTGKNPQVVFNDSGHFNVQLTVTTSMGCSHTTQSVVTVNKSPTAKFAMAPIYGTPPLTVTFLNLSTDAGQYDWDFGDGSTSALKDPVHTFQQEGIFNVVLNATTDKGCYEAFSDNVYTIKPNMDIELLKLEARRQDDLLEITVDFRNNSLVEVHQVDLRSWITGESPVQERWEAQSTGDRLLPGNTKRYRFISKLVIPEDADPERNVACARVQVPEVPVDLDPSNDQECVPFIGEFAVNNPFPNPVRDNASLDVIIEIADHLVIELYDMHGHKIATLFDRFVDEGLSRIEIPVSSMVLKGVYILSVRHRDHVVHKKIILTE